MKTHGFTITELVVVIAVIGILSTLTAFATLEIQKDVRDNKRETDIALFQNELEKYYDKNGVYPPGCRNNCTSWFFTHNTSTGGTLLNSTITLPTLQTILPGIPSNFAEPKNPDPSLPLLDPAVHYPQGGASQRYFYFGGMVNNNASSQSSIGNSTPYVSGVSCTFLQTLKAGEVSSYIVGYYSEGKQKWVFKQGNRGVKATLHSSSHASCEL